MAASYAAHDLSKAALGGEVRIQDGRFVDNHGRTLTLRGVNVSGASKLPTTPNGLSHLHDGFYESHRTVSFVGRPFPLSEAPRHFARLQAWGLPLIRLLVTWESLAHSGPSVDDIDYEYIDYLTQLISLMPKYGLKCFVCAHQDVWSRFSGGSGAPGWTFEAAGLDIEAFTDTGAAYVHSQDEKRKAEEKHAQKPSDSTHEPSGAFLWPSGYQKLAASTMATLFWAGDSFAPKLRFSPSTLASTKANGTNGSSNGTASSQNPLDEDQDGKIGIQTFLQTSYIEAFGRLADSVASLEACLGFEPMNEPHRGLINLHDFHGWNYDTDLHIGHYPTLIEALALGSGYKQKVKFYVKSWPFPTRVSHTSLIDPQGRSCWLANAHTTQLQENASMANHPHLGMCVWRAHGVWEWDESKQAPVVLRYDYFETDHRPGRQGRRVEWYRDFYAPFLAKFQQRVDRSCSSSSSPSSSSSSSMLSFVEPIPNEFVPPWLPPSTLDRDALKEYREAAYAQKYAAKTMIDTPRPGGQERFVYAPHFYDLNVLFGKHHSWMSVNVQGLSRGMFVLKALYFGAKALRRNYSTQLRTLLEYATASLGQVPVVIGEVGIPFDINGRFAYRTGDYGKQRELMDALISAMEDHGLGYTLWNYNPDNRVAYGDGWNFEDFSITNGDTHPHEQIKQDYRNAPHADDPLYAQGRVLDVVIRPYAVKVAGLPIRSHFDAESLTYELEWQNPPSSNQGGGGGDGGGDEKKQEDDVRANTTEIFLPAYHYKGLEFGILTSDAEYTFNAELQSLFVQHADMRPNVRHKLRIELRDPRAYQLSRIALRRQLRPRPLLDSFLPQSLERRWIHSSTSHLTSILLVLLAALSAVVAVDYHFVKLINI
ncbi:glycoside hydrolase [Testicularia cyperi]|uniref:Glycoside hydrolase n=1 Tax=Testicularia cyperi TaxID=1882483 RepID=A0A317Y0G4_9BASI|nr:glycoside hydrolase [Testicularia cyperi]